MPRLLVSEYHMSKAAAGGQASLFILLAIITRPLGGMLGEKVKASSILSAVFLVAAILQIVLAFQPILTVLIPAFLVIAFLLGLGNGALFKLVGAHSPKEA